MSGWKKIRAVFTICAALGWWGMWFPELALWTDAVCVVEEDSASVQSEENVVQWLLRADREQIQLKSRFLELLRKYKDCN